jgi:hypothetical protein
MTHFAKDGYSFTIGSVPFVPFPRRCVVCEAPSEGSIEVTHQSLLGTSVTLKVPICGACKRRERWSAVRQMLLVAAGSYLLVLLAILALAVSSGKKN